MFRKGVIQRNLHLLHVDEHKVATLWFGIGQVELGPDLVEAVHFGFHVGNGLRPEALGFGLFKAYGACFLEGGHGGVADAGVGCGDVFYKVGGADEPAYGFIFSKMVLFWKRLRRVEKRTDSPACSVEILASRSDGDC